MLVLRVTTSESIVSSASWIAGKIISRIILYSEPQPDREIQHQTSIVEPAWSNRDSLYGGGAGNSCVSNGWWDPDRVMWVRRWVPWWEEIGSNVTWAWGAGPRLALIPGDWYFFTFLRLLCTLYPKKASKTTKRTAQPPSTTPMISPLLLRLPWALLFSEIKVNFRILVQWRLTQTIYIGGAMHSQKFKIQAKFLDI